MKRWALAWGPAAIWAAFLFLLSSRPTIPVDLSSGIDKVGHFAAYLVLGILLAHGTRRFSYPAVVAIVLGMLYGASDEWHQSMVPGRTAEFGDWIADALGSIAGVALYIYFRRRRAPAPGTTTAALESA